MCGGGLLIKIAIADDQSLFRNMLAYILNQDPEFEVIGEVGDGNELFALCEGKRPDVVLLDIKMPNANGISTLIKLKEHDPTIKVIMLTTFEEDEYIFEACRNKADAYIVKDTKPEVLVHIIKCVYGDLFVMHASVKQYMVRQMQQAEQFFAQEPVEEDADFDSVDLTIMRLISIGKNNAEIAEQIRYSEGTVKNRISKMLANTKTKDRTQLAIFALQNGIV